MASPPRPPTLPPAADASSGPDRVPSELRVLVRDLGDDPGAVISFAAARGVCLTPDDEFPSTLYAEWSGAEETSGRRVDQSGLLRLERELAVAGRGVRSRAEGARIFIDYADEVLVVEDVRHAAVLAELLHFAPHVRTALAIGETGAGKELLAKLFHARAQPQGPFVPINCSAIPGKLFESELFGHTKGAFNDAEARLGAFREADGGTLFLDEIGEMPLDQQPKLLRVLETREVRPVGADRPVLVDVRVVAGTNARLEERVARGTFREDLWYRLSGATFEALPLRARRVEIVPLASHFARAWASKRGRVVRVSPEAFQVLHAHAWPGNVRELKNAVEFACSAMRDEDRGLQPRHLPRHIRAARPADPARASTDLAREKCGQHALELQSRGMTLAEIQAELDVGRGKPVPLRTLKRYLAMARSRAAQRR